MLILSLGRPQTLEVDELTDGVGHSPEFET